MYFKTTSMQGGRWSPSLGPKTEPMGRRMRAAGVHYRNNDACNVGSALGGVSAQRGHSTHTIFRMAHALTWGGKEALRLRILYCDGL